MISCCETTRLQTNDISSCYSMETIGGETFISEFAFLYQSALLLCLSVFFFIFSFFLFIFAAFHFGARECRVDDFLADTIPRSFFYSFLFLFIYIQGYGEYHVYMLATRLSLSFHFSRKFWRAKALLDLGLFLFTSLSFSLSFSLFFLLYTLRKMGFGCGHTEVWANM